MARGAKWSETPRIGSLAAASLLVALLAIGVTAPEAPGRDEAPATEPRIVNGKGTSIERWPWQVALVDRSWAPRGPVTDQYFCTGSLIAPDLVVTAAHCVESYRPTSLDGIRVIAGRTWLNNASSGESLKVSRVIMALDSKGKRRYRIQGGAAVWDIALVKLASRSSATPIAIAGESERAALRPGRPARTTGWGETGLINQSVSNRLRVAAQVILPDGVCSRDRSYVYRSQTMICHGGPEGNSTSCSGDSGGPLVSPVGGGWRLIGLTSFGDAYCRGNVPSVDNRTAADPVRSWVRSKALEVSGYDPVSEGGSIGPLPRSCKVPGLSRRTRSSARQALRKAGCSLKAIRSVGRPTGGKRRVVGASLPAGWLAPRGFGITIALRR